MTNLLHSPKPLFTPMQVYAHTQFDSYDVSSLLPFLSVTIFHTWLTIIRTVHSVYYIPDPRSILCTWSPFFHPTRPALSDLCLVWYPSETVWYHVLWGLYDLNTFSKKSLKFSLVCAELHDHWKLMITYLMKNIC